MQTPRIGTWTIDRQPVEGGQRCTSCQRVKPACQFRPSVVARGSGDCRVCHRIAMQIRRESPEVQAASASYYRRPEVTAAYRARYEARNKEAMYAQQREYRASERGQLVGARKCARSRLKRAKSEEQRERLQHQIDRYTAALAALDAEDA